MTMTQIHYGWNWYSWRQCRRKVPYRSQKAAVEHAQKAMGNNPRLRLYFYRCNMCKDFHLTKKADGNMAIARAI